MSTKKELKQAVLENFSIMRVRTKRRVTFVELSYRAPDGKLYVGYDFAEWNSEDRAAVKVLTQMFKESVKCGCMLCWITTQVVPKLIEKLDYSEAMGIEIAKGRAVKSIVDQLMADQKKAEVPQGDTKRSSGDGILESVVRESRVQPQRVRIH